MDEKRAVEKREPPRGGSRRSTSTPKTPNSDKPPTPRWRPNPKPPIPSLDKAQAVLAVWTERCKPADVCRQLQINWITLNQWQTRALEGMLQALESRVNLAQGQALSRRLRSPRTGPRCTRNCGGRD